MELSNENAISLRYAEGSHRNHQLLFSNKIRYWLRKR
jgi:hypothetical protein